MSAPGTDGSGSVRAVPSAMTEAAQGIEDVVAELRDIEGITGRNGVGQASVGRGLSQLAYPLGWSATGDDRLTTALGEFFGRWEWGVRSLVQQAEDLSSELAASGAEYQQAEDFVAGSLKRVVFDATGDPTGDPAAASGMSWEQLAANGAPDLTTESLTDAADHASTTWGETIEDAAASSVPGMVTQALNGENPFQGQLDDIADLLESLD